ncbi:MAG: hypothetical protein CSA95_09370 [Bacteroidetes bacterium]|nr:MAG: hypothetical protein CSA95_09370 [Bacteroidota bacterium]
MKITGSKRAGNTLTLFMLVWGIVALWQASKTGLLNDEAYYRMYALYPDTGYFDHPPMAGWLMHPWLHLLSGSLGVRFNFVLTGLLSLIALFSLIKPSGKTQVKRLILLLVSMPFVHAASFFAAPDTPLVLFSVLFFLLLKRYLFEDNLKNALLLTLPITGMLYAKYHGILLIFFTLIAFPDFFKRKTFYLTVAGSLLLFLPHILWQYQHDFVTLGYHLRGRVKTWSPLFIADYLGGQLLILGGLATIPMLIAASLPKRKDPFIRILRFNLWGTLLFFLVASFRMHIEANWTLCLITPIAYLSYHGLENRPKLWKTVKILAIPTLILLTTLRVLMVYEVSKDFPKSDELYGWEEWAAQIEQHAGDKPVVFMNSYQRAAKFSFLTHRFAHTFNSVRYRRNQYDLWDHEERLQGQEVFFMPNNDIFSLPYIQKATIDSFKTRWNDYAYYTTIPDFKTMNKIRIAVHNRKTTYEPNEQATLQLTFTNPYPYPTTITQQGEKPIWVVATMFDHTMKQGKESYLSTETFTLSPQEQHTLSISLTMPPKEGTYYYAIGLAVDWLPPAYNSRFYKINVKECH